MKLKNLLRWALLIGLFLTSAACQKEAPTAAQSNVKANQAYISFFGQPPASAKGECFARVGFYPLRSDREKLQAVPFFLFDAKTELPLLFARLVNNPAAFPEDGPLANPFPPGTSVRVGSRAATLEMELNLAPPASPERLAEMARALTQTAGQYPDIRQVRLLLNGAPWPGMPEEGFRPDPGRVVDPGPPWLMLVVGSWESGAGGPGEILADFDRPVSIQSFGLRDEAGKKLEGDYFTSAFDMAVVIHPRNPADFHEGMELRADWRVTDRLGRQGEGEGAFPLVRQDHDGAR